MMIAFALSVCVTVVPLFATYLLKGRRASIVSLSPILVPLGFFAFSMSDAILAPIFSYGWTKLFIELGLVTGILYFCVDILDQAFRSRLKKLWTPRLIASLALFSMVASLDLLWIFHSMQWGETVSLRPPFSTHGQKLLIELSSLVQGSSSPFLLGAKPAHPSFWLHWAAPLVWASSSSLSLFSAMKGALLGSALIAFFVLAAMLVSLHPSSLKKPFILAVGAILLSLHADIFSLVGSLASQKVLGLAIDGSFSRGFLQFQSLKAILISNPEELMALVFLSISLASKRLFSGDANIRRAVDLVSFTGAFCASPALSAIFWLVKLSYKCFVSARNKTELTQVLSDHGVSALSAIILFWLVNGVSPNASFRVLTQSLTLTPLTPLSPKEWVTLPALFIGMGGVTGILLTIVLADRVRKGSYGFLLSFPSFLCVISALLFSYVVTSPAIRSLLSVFFVVFGVLFIFRYGKTLVRGKNHAKIVALSVGAIAILCHSFFIYCYVGKPSSVRSIRWADYLSLGQLIAQKFPQMGVAGASSFEITGMPFSPIMEFTPSFVGSATAMALSEPRPEQLEVMRVMESRQPVPYLSHLGYRAILWGPVEKNVWGNPVYHRFIEGKTPLIANETVALYELSDSFTASLAEKPGTKQYHIELAKMLKEYGWGVEAAENYARASNLDPKDADVLLSLGKTLNEIGQDAQAIEVLKRADQIRPQNPEILNAFAMSLIRKSGLDAAIQVLEQIIRIDPKNTTAFNNLGALLVIRARYPEAITALNKGLKFSPKDPQLHLNLGRAHLGAMDLERAETHYRLALSTKKDSDLTLVRREAYSGLGDVASKVGDTQTAIQNYESALEFDKTSPDLYLKVGEMYARIGKVDEAKQNLVAALQINPNYAPALSALAILGRMGNP